MVDDWIALAILEDKDFVWTDDEIHKRAYEVLSKLEPPLLDEDCFLPPTHYSVLDYVIGEIKYLVKS